MYRFGYSNLWCQKQTHFLYLKPIFCFDSFAHFDKSHIVIINQLEAMREPSKTSCERFATFASSTWYEKLLQQLISSKRNWILYINSAQIVLFTMQNYDNIPIFQYQGIINYWNSWQLGVLRFTQFFSLTLNTKSIIKVHFKQDLNFAI